MGWATLPQELLSMIFSFLKCADLTSAVCVNSTWHALADYNNIWKEAILNDSFPHHYSTSQKNVPWLQIAKKHFETKRNIIKRRCVQHTLGTRCPTSRQNANVLLIEISANATHCIITWDMLETQGYEQYWLSKNWISNRSKNDSSYHNSTIISTELWDLEARTIIANHTKPDFELFNDFILASTTFYENSQMSYTKFDPEDSDITPEKVISIAKTNAYISITRSEDPKSSLIAYHWAVNNQQFFVLIYDLRTGKKILERKYDNTNNLVVAHFSRDKLVFRYQDKSGYLLLIDLRQNKDFFIEVASLCATVAGNEVWIWNREGLVKYDIQTKKQTEYKVTGGLGHVTKIRIYDGLIWLFISGTTIVIIDVSSASTTAQILTQILLPGWDIPIITPLANGSYACLATSYAHILSFKDEDIELPIEVLQFEPNGKSEILHIAQGDLNKMIAEYSSTSVSSQIVFEDEYQRCILIYVYTINLKDKGVNQFAETARKWIEKPEYHKTAIFQLVHFNTTECKRMSAANTAAIGRAWVIYETKVTGAWQRAAPQDYWKFFKTKLKLK